MDGSTQYITHTDNAAYDVLDNISISMWFKRSGTGKKFLISKGTNGFGLYIEPANRLVITKPNVADLVTGKKIIADKEWHQVVITLGGGTASIYLDGFLDNSAATGTTFAATATSLFIGQDSGNLFHFNGSIKDVRINNGLWTSNDVANLYVAGPNTTEFTSNLVLWDKLNEGTGTTVTDSSATANNGTITGRTTTGGVPSTMWVIDPVWPPRMPVTSNNTSVLFNGSTSSGTITHNAAYDFGSGDFTIELKARVTSLAANTYQIALLKYNAATGGWNLGFWENAASFEKNRWQFVFRTTATPYAIASSNVECTNKWVHLIAVVNRTAQENFRLFVNGVHDVRYLNSTDYTSVGSVNSAGSINIGNSSGSADLTGNEYDFRMYNRALTDDECLSRTYANENITSGLVGKFAMQEAEGTTIADTSSTANNGTLSTITWVPQTLS